MEVETIDSYVSTTTKPDPKFYDPMKAAWLALHCSYSSVPA